jgi:hypothetical protein
MKRSWLGLAVLALILATLACGKAPEAEMESAKAAMDDAQPSAEKWASSEWQAAQSSMSQAQAEIEAQNQKWFKNYDKSKELLAQAKADAEKAKAAAVTNKETAKNEATAAIADATAAMEAAKTALAGAPKGKDTKADLALFQQDLDGMATTLTEAETAMQSEDYTTARDKANSIKEKATSISDQIAQAAAKKAGARK